MPQVDWMRGFIYDEEVSKEHDSFFIISYEIAGVSFLKAKAKAMANLRERDDRRIIVERAQATL